MFRTRKLLQLFKPFNSFVAHQRYVFAHYSSMNLKFKAALRYAGVRSLNKVAMKHPSAVTACNLDLENLITDSNRSIATLAITTLLKTGSESSVDRLMKQISTFMSEISDEFKVTVINFIFHIIFI